MLNKIVIAATLALASSAACAADAHRFYAGADVGSTTASGESGHETSVGAFAGYQFTQNIGVEVGYRSLASASDEGFDGDLNQFSVSAIGTIPLSNGFSVYGRLGANRIGAKVSGGGVSASDHANRLVYGIGMGYSFTPTITGRLEVQKPMSDITNLSAGVSFQF